jgi:antirestriction protein ArdC
MNIYESVTERILQQLEQGTIPWRKTWTAGLPANVTTGKEYRGINLLILGSSGHASRYWVTFRQALRLGGHVRKGERATQVIYWKWRTPKELAALIEKTGIQDPAPCVPFVSSVFNLDQVDGVVAPAEEALTHRRLEIADLLLDVMPDKPTVEHSLLARPAYSSGSDRITLPHLSQFESADEYYSTLFHELVHSAGHPRRLNRIGHADFDPNERYSFEELVAEFGASFLCSFTGIENPHSQALQAGYIQSWAQVFRKDHHILIRAASAAQKAADYIRGKTIASDGESLAA